MPPMETQFMNRSRFTLLVSIVMLAFAASAGCTMVEPGTVVLEVSKCGSNAGNYDVATTGYNTYNPGCTDLYTFPVHVQNITWTQRTTEGSPVDESITFTTADDQAIGVNVAIDYRFEADKVALMFDEFRVDNTEFVNTFLRNRIRDGFNYCIDNPGEGIEPLEVSDLSRNRTVLFDCVEGVVNSSFNEYGVVVNQIGQIDEFIWPPSVRAAIEASVKATTDAQRVERELQQTEAEAAKVRAKAQGEADAQVMAAEGRARAVKMEAEAQAEANRKLADSLAGPGGARVVEMRRLERWNGSVPQMTMGSDANVSYLLGNPSGQ